jgi:EmrB/QacA subfamily drug resistance transporter
MSEIVEKKARRWWIFIAMLSNIVMIFIDSSVLPVALPSIQRDLGLSDLGLQWLINAYLLALTVLLLAGGHLGDLLGKRRICAFGIAIFTLASLFCGFSNSESWFVIGRAMQGVGGALILPTTSSTLIANFPRNERGRIMGLYLGAGSIFLSLGPFLGGIITQYLDWRYVFWINLPVGALGLTLLLLVVPKSEAHPGKFDWSGFLTLSCGISALVIALMQTPSWGWGWLTWTLLLLGTFLIIALITVDRKIEHPYIDLRFLSQWKFITPVLCVFLIQFLLMLTVFWALYFQHVLDFSPSFSGVIILVANCPIIFVAPIAGHLTDKVGPRLPAMLGFLLVSAGLLWFTAVAESKSFFALLPALISFGCGTPLVLNPCFVSSMNEIPQRNWGVANGLRQTVRQLGGTIGMAVLGALFLHRLLNLLATHFQQNEATLHLNPVAFEGILSSTPDAQSALNSIPLATATTINQYYIQDYASAFMMINIIGAIIALFGFCLAYFTLSRNPTHKP